MERVETRELVATVERLLDEVEGLPDPAARAKTTEVVQALLDLYGAGLERIVEEVAARDDGELAEALAGDELVAHLLLLHGLHPVALEERVRGALEEVRPYLESHGGDVELRAIDGAIVHLGLEGSCSGCPSSTVTLKLAIENAIHKAAPEIEQVVADGAVTPLPAPAPVPGAGTGAQLLQLDLSPTLKASPPATAESPLDGPLTMAGGGPD